MEICYQFYLLKIILLNLQLTGIDFYFVTKIFISHNNSIEIKNAFFTNNQLFCCNSKLMYFFE